MGDRQRRRAFAGAALALLAIAALFTLREPSGRPRPHARPGTTAIQAVAPRSDPADAERAGTISPSSAEPSPSSSLAAAAPSEREARAPAIAAIRAAAALSAARVFLAGYLRYSYGHAKARTIRRATDRLLRALAMSPPRVPATVGRAHPRLVSVRAEAASGDRAINALAVVDDGQRRYSVPLELHETAGRWMVAAVGG